MIDTNLRSVVVLLLAQLNRDEDLNGGLLSIETISIGDQLRRALHVKREVFAKPGRNGPLNIE